MKPPLTSAHTHPYIVSLAYAQWFNITGRNFSQPVQVFDVPERSMLHFESGIKVHWLQFIVSYTSEKGPSTYTKVLQCLICRHAFHLIFPLAISLYKVYNVFSQNKVHYTHYTSYTHFTLGGKRR